MILGGGEGAQTDPEGLPHSEGCANPFYLDSHFILKVSYWLLTPVKVREAA